MKHHSLRTNCLTAGLLLIVSTFVMIPILVYGMFQGDDANLHILWTHYFTEQFFEGDLYPRWLQGMNGGLGSPVFYFYPPLPYYVNLFIACFIDSAQNAHYILAVSAWLSLVIGGYGVYLWLKNDFSHKAAILGAIIYIVAPYHVVVDVLIRASMAELWAMAVIPYLFFSTTLLGRSNYKFFLYLSISTALLLLSHPPSSVIAMPILCLYLLLQNIKKNWFVLTKDMLFIGCPLLLGLGISAFYILPALTLDKSHMEVMWNLHNHTHHFLFDGKLPTLSSIAVEAAMAITVLLMIIAIVLTPPDKRANRHFKIMGGLALFCLFMTTILSRLIWDYAPLIAKVQFPWRYTVIMTLFLSYFYAGSVVLNNNRSKKFLRVHSAYMYLVVIGLSVVSVTGGLLTAKNAKLGRYTPEVYNNILSDSSGAPEYVLGTTRNVIDALRLEGTFYTTASTNADKYVLRGEFEAESKLVLTQYLYGTWHVYLNDIYKPNITMNKHMDGAMQLTLTEPATEVTLIRQEFQQLSLGKYISIISLILLFVAIAGVFFSHRFRSIRQ